MSKFSLSSNKRSLILKILYIMIGVLGLACLMSDPINTTARYRPVKRGCLSNIRFIESTVEMYNMDNVPMMRKLDMNILLKKGYMKVMPACPGVGTYTYASFGDLAVDGKVFCGIHGSLEDELQKKRLENSIEESSKDAFVVINRKRIISAVLCSILYIFVMIFAFAGYDNKKKDIPEHQSKDLPEDLSKAPAEDSSKDIME